MSPYDLARLKDEYPLVFEEWVAIHERAPKESFAKKRERTRGERVARLFSRMKGRK